MAMTTHGDTGTRTPGTSPCAEPGAGAGAAGASAQVLTHGHRGPKKLLFHPKDAAKRLRQLTRCLVSLVTPCGGTGDPGWVPHGHVSTQGTWGVQQSPPAPGRETAEPGWWGGGTKIKAHRTWRGRSGVSGCTREVSSGSPTCARGTVPPLHPGGHREGTQRPPLPREQSGGQK